MARYREDDRVCREAGLVTHDEAQEILHRFNASHWRNSRPVDGECARYTIPANPRRDDDIRLGVYISRQERVEKALVAVLDLASARLNNGPHEANVQHDLTEIQHIALEALH